MTRTFETVDTQFAVSTGDNINARPGVSTFDGPPSESHDLVITSNSDDDDAFLFEVGDEYDISFGGPGGTILDNATVLRSDYINGGGVVVFEGTTADGTPVQVVWSPGYDMESWYWAHRSDDHQPGFYTSERDTQTYRYVCFTSGTWIDTPAGPVPVQALAPGRQVLTADHGPQPLRWVGQRQTLGAGTAAPVVFAPGAFGNPGPLAVSQQHRILVRHPIAELLFGHSELWVPARALVNGDSIRIEPRHTVTYFHLLLDRHEVLTASGIPAESLFLGDIALSRLKNERIHDVAAFYPQVAEIAGNRPMTLSRPALKYSEARVLAHEMGVADNAQDDAPDWLVAA